MPKPKDLLPIGTYVCFQKHAYSCFDWHTAHLTFQLKKVETSYLSSPNKNYIGQIVGGTYLSEGECKQDTVTHRSATGFRDRFTATKKIFVYLVRCGFINKPIKVLPEDIKIFNGIKKEIKFIVRNVIREGFEEQSLIDKDVLSSVYEKHYDEE